MTLEAKSRSPEEDTPYETFAPEAIAEHLNEILASSPFRTSKQCKDLLRFLVEHSTGNDDGSLRERVIGMQVFGRVASYDTNEDPVVRIRAADVRKRLAQFYQSRTSSDAALHLDLLPGSYRVRFRKTGPPTQPSVEHAALQAASSTENKLASGSIQRLDPGARPELPLTAASGVRRIGLGGIAFAVASILMLVVAFSLIRQTRVSPQQQFWAPLTRTDQPVLVYLGSNMAYIFSPNFLSRYRAAHGLPNQGPEFPVDLSAVHSLETKDLLPVQDTFVTTADLSAAVALTSQLRDWKKSFTLRSGRDLSIGDLRDRPTLLIGGFNNPWTLETTETLPFTLREGTTIQEREGQKRSWSVDPHTRASSEVDYALITRLLHSTTGGPSITVAGIGEYGTQAAAELLTAPDKVRGLVQYAPEDWQTKNLEVVLRVKVLQDQPVATEIVAEKVW